MSIADDLTKKKRVEDGLLGKPRSLALRKLGVLRNYHAHTHTQAPFTAESMLLIPQFTNAVDHLEVS